MTKKDMLFYSVLAIFISTAVITLLGVLSIVDIKNKHLDWLLITLVGEVVAVFISLFKRVDVLDDEENKRTNFTLTNESITDKISIPNIGNPSKKITLKEEKTFFKTYSQWNIVEKQNNGTQSSRELHRVYEFKTFDSAFSFMNKATNELIIPQSHHPTWKNTYNRVEIWLTTFNINKQISNRDIKLATTLENLWVSVGKGLNNV